MGIIVVCSSVVIFAAGSLPRPLALPRKHAKRPDTSWTRLRGHYSLSPLFPIFPPLDLVHASPAASLVSPRETAYTSQLNQGILDP